MDYQNRAGSKFGGGGVAGKQETAMDRRERLRRLALDTFDPAKDPYAFINDHGKYECKLCHTTHLNQGSYLAHTQGKKHQTNLARREAMERKTRIPDPSTVLFTGLYPTNVPAKNLFPKIGRPGYKVTKVRDPVTLQLGLFLQLLFPQITRDVKPRFQFMSACVQKVEPADTRFQYLIVVAEPYESVAFKIQRRGVDQREGKLWTHWDPDTKQFSLQFFYNNEREERYAGIFGPRSENRASSLLRLS
jgi:splicing factor 3A subunit 2